MKVVCKADGRHAVENDNGEVIAGPFDSNAAAWRAADRLAGEPVSVAEKRSDWFTTKMLSAGPAPIVPSKKEMKALRKTKKAAAKAPLWLRTGAAATFDPHGARRHRDAKLGTFGPASEVRHIDPAEYAHLTAGRRA